MTEETIEISVDDAIDIMMTLEWMRLALAAKGTLPPKNGALMTIYDGMMKKLERKVDEVIDEMFWDADPVDPEDLLE